ncbi:PepSY domain-containing protein [Bosea vaviloviae]|uniref:PepSY domain-containing protein n=1 Tax=Bosea vaviloviae TaxID=1526658 RepID=UPI000AA5D833|nr:PepSY domain-containing protein [Bosea vaviloviae]
MISKSWAAGVAVLTVMAAILVWPVASARSQTIELGPNGLQINPPEIVPEEPIRPYRRFESEGITEYEAVRLARGEGLDRVERVRQGRRGWVIVGIDVNGDDMRIIISRDGDVIDVQRD